MLAIIGIILIILWALGLGFHIAGSLIHIILSPGGDFFCLSSAHRREGVKRPVQE